MRSDMARIAKRVNNNRRGYLIVNLLQGKHVPVSPTESLRVMRKLGTAVRSRDAAAGPAVVIGFAETATAIGAAVAATLGPDTFYITTTREPAAHAQARACLEFAEVHSHAPGQWLVLDQLRTVLPEANRVILVDDEISTGRTAVSLVERLREAFALPIERVELASLLSRVSAYDAAALRSSGIDCISLEEVADPDPEGTAREQNVREPGICSPIDCGDWRMLNAPLMPDPRKGVLSEQYESAIEAMCRTVEPLLADALEGAGRVLVLGTEECMYPALRLGAYLGDAAVRPVLCHATTRSPIGVCDAPGYPIQNGFRISSFYDDVRTAYLYNAREYDAVVVVSDARGDVRASLADVAGIYRPLGVRTFAHVEV